jgi:hypothetical protein
VTDHLPGAASQLPPSPPSPPTGRRRPGTNEFAIASFVLALVLVGPGSIVAIVLAHVARRQIAASEGGQGGWGLATAGLVLGWIGVVATLLFVAFLVLALRSTQTAGLLVW